MAPISRRRGTICKRALPSSVTRALLEVGAQLVGAERAERHRARSPRPPLGICRVFRSTVASLRVERIAVGGGEA